MPDDSFTEFVRRIRAGDPLAAEELVRRYEVEIRVAVRARLTDPLVRRRLDSLDVCQSVFASFFFRAAAGQYDLRDPRDLVGLLVSMAQNKLSNQIRFHRQEQRDCRRAAPDSALDGLTSGDEPARVAAGRDLLAAVRAGLNLEERELADRRAIGRTWDEIAAELGGTAEGRRKQFARALDRLAPSLGLDGEVGDDA